MCDKCTHLRSRVLSLAQRINKAHVWDPYMTVMKKGAYRLLLQSIESHMVAKGQGHYVDSSEVMIALGKRAI